MPREFPRLVERLSRRQSELDREVVAVRILSKRGVGRAVVSLPGCEGGSVVATEPTPIACGESAQAVINRTSGVVTIFPGPAAAAGKPLALTARVRGTDLAPASLTVSVTVVNDDAGTLTAEDLSIYLDGVLVAVNQAVPVVAGDHALTYDLPTGYTASVWGGDAATDGTITLTPRQVATATITFDDDPVALTVSDVVACDAFASSGGPTDGAGCQHLVTAGLAPASYAFHRWEAYLGGAVTAGDTIRATIISPTGVIFGSGGGPTTTIDITASAINDPWPSGNQRCSQATLGAATMMITGENGGEFLGIPTGATQSTPVRLQFDNLTDPTTSPQIESLTISGTGVANCSA